MPGENSGKYAGNQCAVIALFALAAAFLHPINTWQSSNIENAILSGNDAYTRYIDQQNLQPHYIAQDELLAFNVLPVTNGFSRVNVHVTNIHHGLFYGIIGQGSDISFASSDINHAIQTASEISPNLLLTVASSTIAVINDNNGYYIFDSHARDSTGNVSEHGSAVLLYYRCIDDLCNYLFSAYTSRPFNLSQVVFNTDRGNFPTTANFGMHVNVENSTHTAALPVAQNSNANCYYT